jgi:parallel beta-helix repeat protein
MAQVSNPKIQQAIPIIMLIALFALSPARAQSQDGRPVADAGSSRYTATDPVQLDSSGCYDPDNSGPLSYTWRQIAGPPVVIIDANTAIPTVGGSMLPGTGRDPVPTLGGFIQTNEIQECEFELVVSDGELISLADTVKVIIVPYFGASTLQQENPPFDPNKPTVIYFGGGDCVSGLAGQPWNASEWSSRANVISFPNGYGPDSGGGTRTYYKYGDMIIVYLTSVAPDYRQPIQTIGWSTGGQPAIDVGIRLNSAYQDARYAVNRVTQMDAPCRVSPQWGGSWELYTQIAESFLSSSVDGEQCWLDFYYGTGGLQYEPFQFRYLLDVYLGLGHDPVRRWYRNSLTGNAMNNFNSGVVAGAYWSVLGPGKNLQLAPQTNAYYFRWYGGEQSGSMNFYKEAQYPGRLPEPVTLLGPVDVGDPNGAVLTCAESENAVGYQLLFGSDPYRVMNYYIVSDTLTPPNEVITSLPFEETWWTVRVRDQYGSTIYADPRPINTHALSLSIENMNTGQRYGYIQDAIDSADYSNEIVLDEGVYQESIDFKGKNLIVRSTDPNDSTVVATTILTGDGKNNLVIFSNNEDASCVLAGLTITDANNGIHCSGASPRIASCNIVGNVGDGIILHMGSNPTISNCIIAGNSCSGIAMLKFKSARMTFYNSPNIANCTIVENSEIGISEGKPTVLNSIIYGNSVQIGGSTAVVQYSNVQGGFPGEGNINDDPIFADSDNGDYHLKSQAGRWDSISQIWIQDDVTSPCIDAGDPTSPIGLEPAPNGNRINMGAYGGTLEASKSP